MPVGDEPELEDVIREFVIAGTATMHAALPAVVVAYDPVTQRASCKPVVRRRVPNPVTGDLAPDDCMLGDGSSLDVYEFVVPRDTQVDFALRSTEFDTFLLMGHNYGLLAGPEQAPAFFGALGAMANPGARIIGTNRDPLATTDPAHLAYHQLNRERGREPGQMQIRVRWRRLATPWFDYWFLPAERLAELARAYGWELVDTVHERDHYLAELHLRADT